MVQVTQALKSVTDTGRWAARGTSFMAKVKATKLVWFPPAALETGSDAGEAVTSAATKAPRKTTAAARQTIGTAEKTTAAAKKSTAAARKKSAGAAKKVTGRRGRQP